MVATPVIATVFGSLMLYYLNSRFDEAAMTTKYVAEHVDRVEATAVVAQQEADRAKDRIIVLETTKDANDKLMTSSLDRLKSIDTSVAALANTVAALTATVQTLRDARSPAVR